MKFIRSAHEPGQRIRSKTCGSYDDIIVGARGAGSFTGMLLAREGCRVLIVDRATFPSEVVSTHVVHPLGAAALGRWGLLDRLAFTTESCFKR